MQCPNDSLILVTSNKWIPREWSSFYRAGVELWTDVPITYTTHEGQAGVNMSSIAQCYECLQHPAVPSHPNILNYPTLP